MEQKIYQINEIRAMTSKDRILLQKIRAYIDDVARISALADKSLISRVALGLRSTTNKKTLIQKFISTYYA